MQPIEALELFTSKYLECGEETATTFKIEQRILNDFDSFTQFLESVKQLYSAFPSLQVLFHCEFVHDGSGFSLITDIDIGNEDVKVQKFEIESDTEIPDIFSNDNLVSKLRDFYDAYEDNREQSIDDLLQLIQSCFASGEITDIKITFSFDKKDILLPQIRDTIPDDVNILIFLSYKNFKEDIKKISLFELKNVLLSDKNGTLLLIQGAPSSCFGDYFGMFDLGEAFSNDEILAEFLKNKKNDINNHLKQIRETISAANLNFFLPPQFFNFIKHSESNDNSITSLFYPALLFNLFISFSSFVSPPKNDCLKLTIDGRRIVFSRIEVITDDPGRFKLDGEIIDFTRYSDQINELYTFYLRVFGAMDTGELDDTKIFISKKIISIYSRTYLSFLEHINDISDSTWSEYKFYIREKVDKFINFKEQLTNYIFNHNKEVIQFNTALSDTLSTTLFRVTGFILVFMVGLIAKANGVFGDVYFLIGTILLIFLILVSGYRIYGIKRLYNEHQKQQDSYVEYFKRYLNDRDIKELSKTINDSIFDNEYKRSILILAVIICLIVGIWINFGSINHYGNIIINNTTLQESFP